jgi:hypothetical protein
MISGVRILEATHPVYVLLLILEATHPVYVLLLPFAIQLSSYVTSHYPRKKLKLRRSLEIS